MADNKTLIIMGSSNSLGDTYQVCKHVSKNNGYEFQDLNELVIMPFDYEHENDDDDFLRFMKFVIEEYDTIILASPVYWYSVSGILKNFIDRFTDLITIRKELGKSLEGKSLGLISVSQKNDIGEEYSIPIHKMANYLKMKWSGHAHYAMTEKESWKV